ncbi:MAG: hypothetical protein AAGE76_07140 [Pseudomonadota bacterium]
MSGRLGLRGADLAGALALVAVAGVVIWLMSQGGERPLDRSAMGHRGLVSVLRDAGKDARYANFAPVPAHSLGLRILPILDTDLDTPFERPVDRAAYLKTGTERDQRLDTIREKIALQPTLLVAMKWTRALRYTGYAHDSLLLAEAEVETGARATQFQLPAIVRPRAQTLTVDIAGHRALIYAPQVFAPLDEPRCLPMLPTDFGPLALSCTDLSDTPVFFLADPDLLNNHGLSLAQTAAAATAFLDQIAQPGAIVIDPYDYVFSTDVAARETARKWSDLLRFFAYPFSIVWAGLALMLAILLWRSGRRFGPPRDIFDDRASASRAVSIAAKARLLRLAGNDPELFATHVRNRLRQIEESLSGRAGAEDPIARIEHLTRRSARQEAADFAAAATAALAVGRDTQPHRLQALLEDFERQAERLVHGT